MKRILITTILLSILLITVTAQASIRRIAGYSRRDGTWVSGHYRDTSNDGYSYNNANTLGYNNNKSNTNALDFVIRMKEIERKRQNDMANLFRR